MAPLPNKESWAIGVVDAWKALSFTDDNGIQIILANAAELKTTLDAIVSYVEASPGEQRGGTFRNAGLMPRAAFLVRLLKNKKEFKKKKRGEGSASGKGFTGERAGRVQARDVSGL